jgi:carotenoid 1,2-hydratase
VAPGGYLWWYVDAISDDGAFGLTVICFVGSVFSPYYHWKGYREPENHVAINVALYGKGVRRWTMTERGKADLHRSSSEFCVGKSRLSLDGAGFLLEIDEIHVPARPVQGRIRIRPETLNNTRFAIDPEGKHGWMPLAPVAKAEVDFSAPDLHWRGHAYVDSNGGVEPIARPFRRWDWSRAEVAEGCAALYDVTNRDGSEKQIAVLFNRQGEAIPFEPPPRMDLPKSRWLVKRQTQSEGDARVTATFEDTPFYTRSLLSSRLFGQRCVAMHESLDLDRLDNPVTRLMLPFRMPRRAG